jgi:16S rRNA (cytidine1402-2'-O)-methyltransferase
MFLVEEERTMIFYESPHRIIKTLKQFSEYFGEDRKISVSREISKMFEETKRVNLIEVLQYFEDKKPKGEFVIIVDGKK